jgi:hypothetical protein
MATRAALTASLREEVIWSGPCVYCGDEAQLQVDHVIPLSRGGTDDRDNLAPACKRCNMEKLDFKPEEWREWREQEGLGWPPKTGFQLLEEIVMNQFAEHHARHLSDAGGQVSGGQPGRSLRECLQDGPCGELRQRTLTDLASYVRDSR